MRIFNANANANAIAKPGSNYSYGALLDNGRQRLVITGQVGVAPDGWLEQGFEARGRRRRGRSER